MPVESLTCSHVYPDGQRCTLTDHDHPGLAELHGVNLKSEQTLRRIQAAMESGSGRLDIVRMIWLGEGPQPEHKKWGVKIWESGLTKGGNHKWVPITTFIPSEGQTILTLLEWLGTMAVES